MVVRPTLCMAHRVRTNGDRMGAMSLLETWSRAVTLDRVCQSQKTLIIGQGKGHSTESEIAVKDVVQ